ncbi:MAG: outer membrane protein assembly factor BamD [Ghiorsea sp.]|nr:outer membrane protein assembly factor BamD [Ghiorsea sp.]
MMRIYFIFTTLMTLMLASCATADLSLSESAERDYFKAERLVQSEQYARAGQYLQKYIANYPYSKYATAAQILRIKTAYLNDEFILSETLTSRFITAHPEHPQRDYAEYTLGMSYYEQSESAKHEQVFSKKAKDTFLALNKRNPNNAYAQEAIQKIQILTNRIAEHEMIIGKFYYERHLYVGAINRFIVVKNKFIESNIAPESLYWLAASYLALQQKVYAHEVIQQLQSTFAGNAWQKKAEKLI